MSQFAVGDRIVFVHPMHPRYEGTVVSVMSGGSFVSVRYDTYYPDKICIPQAKDLQLLSSVKPDPTAEWFK